MIRCASCRPGITVLPPASITRVDGPLMALAGVWKDSEVPSFALLVSGEARCWGSNNRDGQLDPPAGPFTQLAFDGDHGERLIQGFAHGYL